MDFLKRLLGEASAEPEQQPAYGGVAWLEQAHSSNGFERQEAVEMLGRLRHSPALPVLLTRVNDWVPQVRASAVAAVRALMDNAFMAEWVKALESIVALDRARRVDHAALLGDIADFLARPAGLSRVKGALPSLSSAAKRYASMLEWRAAGTEEQRQQLLDSALAGSDIVQARAALAQMPSMSGAAQRTLASAACRSRFSAIRAAGVRQLLEDTAEAPHFILACCLDSSSMVRAMAWGAAQRSGEADVVRSAASALFVREDASARQRAIALQFLCMADAEEALMLCARGAADSSAAVRRVAIQTLLSRKRGSEQEQWLLTALADVSPQVQRLAVEVVQRGGLPPDPARVVEIALAHRDARALSRAFAVLRRYSLWLRLHWLLTTLGRELAADSVQACLAALVVWDGDATSSFATPSEAEEDRVREDWRRHSAALPAALRKSIAWHLQTNYKILRE